MFELINLITDRVVKADLSNPLTEVDFLLSIGLGVAVLIYIRRFPIYRVVLGVLFLYILSIIFLFTGFVFLALMFGAASNIITIALPLIFAPEIRHYLEKLGRLSFLRIPKRADRQRKEEFIRNLVDGVFNLADRNIGATLVLVRRTGLGETVDTGVKIYARFSSKLLETIFNKKGPLHDGAVVIEDERIAAAACLLPINSEVKLDPQFGTRHRSAVAITLDTDAVSIIVSEQRGQVSLAENNKMESDLDRPTLTQRLQKLLK